MTKVYYSTPFCKGDIGKGINDFVSLVPDDAWVVLQDSDSMLLTSNQQFQIQDIAESDPPFDLIGCRTNRLKSPMQAVQGAFDVDSIGWHIKVAKELENRSYGVVHELFEPHVAAGIFMMFRKSLWLEHKFPEKTIQFDMIYSKMLRDAGKKIGIAQGIYLLHLYRYSEANPYTAINHLLPCHKF